MKCLTWILWKRTKSQPILFKFSHFNWPPWRVGQRLLYTALPQPVDSSSSSLSAGDPPKSLSELQPSRPAFLYEPKQNKYWHYIHTNQKKKKKAHPSTNISGGSKAKWSTVYVRKTALGCTLASFCRFSSSCSCISSASLSALIFSS